MKGGGKRAPWDDAFLSLLGGLSEDELNDEERGEEMLDIGTAMVKKVQGILVERGMAFWRGDPFFLSAKFWKAFNHARSHLIHHHVKTEYDFLLIPSIILAAQIVTPEEREGRGGGNALLVAVAARYIAYLVYRQREPTQRRKLARMNLGRVVPR